jgi:hypothetical protein
MVSSRVADLKSLNPDERAELASLEVRRLEPMRQPQPPPDLVAGVRCPQHDAATEAIGCAIMILVRQEPAWEESMRHAAADTLIAKAVACDPEQWTPGMIHRVSRLTARPEFQDVIATQRDNGGTEPRALGLAAEWVLACQHFATVARELAPKQELVDKAQKSLPDRIREYEDARSELEEVIGADCMLVAIPPAVSERGICSPLTNWLRLEHGTDLVCLAFRQTHRPNERRKVFKRTQTAQGLQRRGCVNCMV